LDGILDLGFVSGLMRAGWHHSSAVLGGHIAIFALDFGVIEACFDAPGLEIVRED